MISINRRMLCLVVATAAVLSWEVGCMSRTELSEEKKKLLSDMEEFNRTHGMMGWDLKDIQFSGETLDGIKLFDSTWENVGLKNISLAGCELRNTVLKDADCTNADFSGAVMEKVRFESCDLSQTRLEGSQFSDCEFVGCSTVEAKMDSTTFRGCTFRNHRDETGFFEAARFQSARFEDCHLHNSSFHSAFFRNTLFRGGKLEECSFSGSQLDNVEMNSLNVDHCSFDDVTSRELILVECGSQGISFSNSTIENLELRDCGEFNYLSLSEVECRGLAISGCSLISEPMFYKSMMENMNISDSQVEYLDGAESEYMGVNKITDSRLHGFNLTEAVITGMQIRKCRIEAFLYITGATFENLKLEDIDYADDLEVRADSVTYRNSDSFPGS